MQCLLETESAYHPIQIHRQARQLTARRTGLAGARGRLHRQVADVHQVAVHFPRDLRLLWRRRGDALQPLLFALLVVMLFALAQGRDPQPLAAT
ncbi:heme exporter protein CcmB, partial [Escherichia coli]